MAGYLIPIIENICVSENYIKIFGFIISSAVITALFILMTRPDIQRNENIITHGNPNVSNVAFTFDDGPNPLWMPLLADTLSTNNAKGTFFIVGKEAVIYPEIVRQTNLLGHQMASHSMNHPQNPNLTGLTKQNILKEISDSDKMIGKICGIKKLDFRPPGGGINQTVLGITQDFGIKVIWWSNTARDYDVLPINTVINRIEECTAPGSIILLHQRKYTIAALEKYFIKKTAKYNYVTVQEMVK
jgi:peptidoglycan/xylan/chitin deacetylase (PgdA/CDA1 family)